MQKHGGALPGRTLAKSDISGHNTFNNLIIVWHAGINPSGRRVQRLESPRNREAARHPRPSNMTSVQEAVRHLNEYLSNELRPVRPLGALRNRILSLIGKPDGVKAATPPGTEAILSNEA